MKGAFVGASHGNDCSFIFNNPALSNSSLKTVVWSEDDRKVMQQLVSQMANFIRKRLEITALKFENKKKRKH